MQLKRQQEESSQDAQRVRTLQRENAQLHLRMKGITSELDEIRAQKEHTGIQSDSVLRLQQKQIAEHAANVKSLEVKCAELKEVKCAELKAEREGGRREGEVKWGWKGQGGRRFIMLTDRYFLEPTKFYATVSYNYSLLFYIQTLHDTCYWCNFMFAWFSS